MSDGPWYFWFSHQSPSHYALSLSEPAVWRVSWLSFKPFQSDRRDLCQAFAYWSHQEFSVWRHQLLSKCFSALFFVRCLISQGVHHLGPVLRSKKKNHRYRYIRNILCVHCSLIHHLSSTWLRQWWHHYWRCTKSQLWNIHGSLQRSETGTFLSTHCLIKTWCVVLIIRVVEGSCFLSHLLLLYKQFKSQSLLILRLSSRMRFKISIRRFWWCLNLKLTISSSSPFFSNSVFSLSSHYSHH